MPTGQFQALSLGYPSLNVFFFFFFLCVLIGQARGAKYFRNEMGFSSLNVLIFNVGWGWRRIFQEPVIFPSLSFFLFLFGFGLGMVPSLNISVSFFGSGSVRNFQEQVAIPSLNVFLFLFLLGLRRWPPQFGTG
jgi:hypothetical protein